MGVVRREGQWRLEKLEDGHYEITYQRNTETKVLTPEYNPGMMDDASFSAVPVHEVGSYKEAEGIFEEHAHGNQQPGMSPFGGGGQGPADTGGSNSDFGLGLGSGSSEGAGFDTAQDDVLDDVDKLPPGGFAIVLMIAGLAVIWVIGFAPGELSFLLGAALFIGGVLIFGWAGFLFRTKGWDEAADFLLTVNEDDAGSSTDSISNSSEPEKTPPPPDSLTRELIFGRADQKCEWCGEHLDNPEVHHIEKRSEGGPNEPDNLMILCPTCHEKADRGGISKKKLREKLKHIQSG